MATFDWSKLKPFVQAVKKACDNGVLAMGVVVQSSVQKSFVAAGKFQSSPVGGPPAKHRGMLRNSILVEMAGPMRARVGSNLPYASVHEFGGVIRARNVRFLPVPINDAAKRLHEKKGTSSLRQMGSFRFIKPMFGRQALLVGDNGVRTQSYGTDASGKRITIRRNDQPVFVLKSSVRIPARPFMRPALARSRNNRGMTVEFCAKTSAALKANGVSVKVVPT